MQRSSTVRGEGASWGGRAGGAGGGGGGGGGGGWEGRGRWGGGRKERCRGGVDGCRGCSAPASRQPFLTSRKPRASALSAPARETDQRDNQMTTFPSDAEAR